MLVVRNQQIAHVATVTAGQEIPLVVGKPPIAPERKQKQERHGQHQCERAEGEAGVAVGFRPATSEAGGRHLGNSSLSSPGSTPGPKAKPMTRYALATERHTGTAAPPHRRRGDSHPHRLCRRTCPHHPLAGETIAATRTTARVMSVDNPEVCVRATRSGRW